MPMVGFDANVLRRLFEKVYFISGTAYAGKSTMVRMLAEKHDGIACGENYNEVHFDLIDPAKQPNLGYFQTMPDWQAFIHRTPEAYEAWIDGCAREGVQLEVLELIRACAAGKPVFVDTNIPLDVLRDISDDRRVALMLSDPSVSVNRFFDRPDREKQFLYRCILEAEDSDRAMASFRACLERINSPERVKAFEESGFFVLWRDESRTLGQTLEILERHFGLI